MILSMTGYGRGLTSSPNYTVTIDLKSVNHRYLDLNIKIPKSYSFLEEKIRREVSSKLSRGKIDVVVNIERHLSSDVQVQLNNPLVTAYLNAIREMQSNYSLGGEIDIQSIINLPDVFVVSQIEEDQEEVLAVVTEALVEALNNLIRMRQVEGQTLLQDFNSRILLLKQFQQKIAELSPEVVLSYRDKLTKKIQELTENIEIDPARIATEVAIFAERSDISEELVRIESHLEQFTKILELSEPIGRRLDFLIQELNREINTVGSKANDLQIGQIVIDFKSELEKLREQVQNIE
ncbi:MAG TPA: YicC family protein [Bacillota bacterium]|nr:YicC family protein [Bacillota bacterium]HOL10469.1 YicC family protein [Bacillota bacterium]HPO98170.1 YicC family protein [Bacillota bacterium]